MSPTYGRLIPPTVTFTLPFQVTGLPEQCFFFEKLSSLSITTHSTDIPLSCQVMETSASKLKFILGTTEVLYTSKICLYSSNHTFDSFEEPCGNIVHAFSL